MPTVTHCDWVCFTSAERPSRMLFPKAFLREVPSIAIRISNTVTLSITSKTINRLQRSAWKCEIMNREESRMSSLIVELP